MSTSRNTVTLEPAGEPIHLVVEPRGMDKVWSFRTELRIPLEHVRGATYDPGLKRESKGLRGPGLGMPNKLAGTFHTDGTKQFWNISGFENVLVITLEDEEFTALYLSVVDPEGLARVINAVLART
ncbi:hypothetical protein [Actinomyces haliotis]|uniref:hypothetical protein n=1 Tax=Actinomyces haliotis TaxID=1280843 RepID=UPI00188FB907|nr:hypothetical protein [Actinomyces haliotis]